MLSHIVVSFVRDLTIWFSTVVYNAQAYARKWRLFTSYCRKKNAHIQIGETGEQTTTRMKELAWHPFCLTRRFGLTQRDRRGPTASRPAAQLPAVGTIERSRRNSTTNGVLVQTVAPPCTSTAVPVSVLGYRGRPMGCVLVELGFGVAVQAQLNENVVW
jgi:hypothetical protein